MKRNASFASGVRLNMVLCCAAAALMTACGGDINDGAAIAQSATAAEVTSLAGAEAPVVTATDPLEAGPAGSEAAPTPAPEAVAEVASASPSAGVNSAAASAAATQAPGAQAAATPGTGQAAAAPAPTVKLTGYETPLATPAAAGGAPASADASPAGAAAPLAPSTVDPETGMPTAGMPAPATAH